MKTLKISMVLIAVILLAGPPIFAREGNVKALSEQNLQMLMEENDTMMQAMHGMMDRFKEMAPESKGMEEMEAMMQKMGQMRTNHRMEIMLQENGQMMALMHKVMGHLKEMEGGDEAGKREMDMMMNRIESMRTHHEQMMTR